MERGVKSTMMMEIEKCASLKIEEERGEQSIFKLRETMSIRSSSRYGLRAIGKEMYTMILNLEILKK